MQAYAENVHAVSPTHVEELEMRRKVSRIYWTGVCLNGAVMRLEAIIKHLNSR